MKICRHVCGLRWLTLQGLELMLVQTTCPLYVHFVMSSRARASLLRGLAKVRCLWEGVDVGERKTSLAHQALPFVLILSRMKQDCHRSPVCAGATALVEHTNNNLTPRSTIRYGLPLWCTGIHTSLRVQAWVACMPDVGVWWWCLCMSILRPFEEKANPKSNSRGLGCFLGSH